MNKKQKFENFLESLKGQEHDVLIESIKQGFQACFENAMMDRINQLMEKEKGLRAGSRDYPQAEEATQEDLDAGYGVATTAQDYINSLTTPYISIDGDNGWFIVYFYGNYESSSVNAGMSKKVFIDSGVSAEEVVSLIKYLSANKIETYLTDYAKELLANAEINLN